MAGPQGELFGRTGAQDGTVAVNGRCVVRSDEAHRVVLVAGMPIAQYAIGDRMAEAHAALLRKDDLDIGTSAVEGAVRNLVRMRLYGPGMRWSLDRAERVLHLRCVLLNGQRNELVEFVARRRIKLAAQPLPARPHTAKAAA